MQVVVEPVLHVPDYEVEKCDIGVVHIGLGAFHRAHQAAYLDRYMELTKDLRWGVAAVNLRTLDSKSFEKAQVNDGYVLKTITTDGAADYRLVRCHRMFFDWSQLAEDAEAIIARPSVKIITVTVTESGYSLDSSGALNLDDPVIVEEVAGSKRSTIYAYLRAGLTQRMQDDAGPLTILCCDNLRENGHLLQRNFQTYLRKCRDENLLIWVEENVTFPASMVDRITPRLDPAVEAETRQQFGSRHETTVLAEDFIQWVIEDDFATVRPALEKVGVTIVADIDPYEETKIRVLNGGHTCLTYLGALAGHKSFDQLMHDPALFHHYWSYETGEVLPALTIDVPFDTQVYLDTVTDRFKNAHIADSVERICADGFAKFPIFIAPTLRGCLLQAIPPTFAYRSIASWYVFAKRVINGQLDVHYQEPNLDALRPLVAEGNTEAFISSPVLWGDMPLAFPGFKPDLLSAIKEMERAWPMSA